MISITDKPIDVNMVLEEAYDDSSGATTVFIGTVRDHNEGKMVSAIHYEVYREMAERVFLEIENETTTKWNLKKFIAVHRVGDLHIGEVSVMIAVSTEHRKESFEACRYAIDMIKTRVPIWKKEKSDAGEYWRENIQVR